ncbi:MAG: type I-E CRISPR-associated protein Cse2/CasB [Azospirillaceae bacterium]|nr:type I-E CRISPR-associated protein Cse2/CasB [Azospirillaceae bacterium]
MTAPPATPSAPSAASPPAGDRPRDLFGLYKPVFQDWWDGLTDAANDHTNPQRGPLARLRRLGIYDSPTGPLPDVATALSEGAFQHLYKAVRGRQPRAEEGGKRLSDDQEESLVVVAATLAHVRGHRPGRTAALLGGPEDGPPRLLAEARFLRLMRVETAAELMDQARRLVALLGREAPVGDLGASLFLWRVLPKVRRDWARSYYGLDLAGHGAAKPGPIPPSQDAPEPGAA